MEVLLLNFLEMGGDDAVERDADGLPRAWPLLKVGDNVVTRSEGMPLNLRLTHDDLAAIVQYHDAKGVKIPIDSEHVVSNLAGKLGMDEAELLRKLPRYSGVAGFGNLELRGDALYLVNAEYLDVGKEVLRAGQFRYFSPSLRGLDGKSPLRVTSVALTNTPHLQNVPALTAGEKIEDEAVTPEAVAAAIREINQQKEATMPEDPATKKETVPEAPPAAAPETPEKPDKSEELLKLIREVLGEDVTAENLKARLAALKTTADGNAELADKVKALECAEESRKLADVRAKALKQGKLTPAMLERDYFKNMTSVELADYCANVADGCAAPVAALELGETKHSTAEPPKHYNSVGEAIAAAETSDMKGY